jgi:hypothetical protein
MAANDTQVAGTHYASGIQHWDFVVANDLNYFEGQITKYVTRCRKKGQCVQDLKKARHFLDKYIELQEANERQMAHEGLGINTDDKFAQTFEAEIGASRRREGGA